MAINVLPSKLIETIGNILKLPPSVRFRPMRATA